MKSISKAGESLEVGIWVVGSVTGGLLAKLMCDPMVEYLNLADRSVCPVPEIGSWTNNICEVGCTLVWELL